MYRSDLPSPIVTPLRTRPPPSPSPPLASSSPPMIQMPGTNANNILPTLPPGAGQLLNTYQAYINMLGQPPPQVEDRPFSLILRLSTKWSKRKRIPSGPTVSVLARSRQENDSETRASFERSFSSSRSAMECCANFF